MRPCPFQFHHPSLPSLCPLLGLYFLSGVCLTLPQSRGRVKLPTHSPSLWVSFLFLILSLSVLCRAAAPWQHWQWKSCICLSCMLSLCCPVFSSSRWVSCRQRNRWRQGREGRQNSGGTNCEGTLLRPWLSLRVLIIAIYYNIIYFIIIIIIFIALVIVSVNNKNSVLTNTVCRNLGMQFIFLYWDIFVIWKSGFFSNSSWFLWFTELLTPKKNPSCEKHLDSR